MGTIFDERLKQGKLGKNNDLNTVKQRTNRNEEKIGKLKTFDLGCFHFKYFLVMMVFKICLLTNEHLICWV